MPRSWSLAACGVVCATSVSSRSEVCRPWPRPAALHPEARTRERNSGGSPGHSRSTDRLRFRRVACRGGNRNPGTSRRRSRHHESMPPQAVHRLAVWPIQGPSASCSCGRSGRRNARRARCSMSVRARCSACCSDSRCRLSPARICSKKPWIMAYFGIGRFGLQRIADSLDPHLVQIQLFKLGQHAVFDQLRIFGTQEIKSLVMQDFSFRTFKPHESSQQVSALCVTKSSSCHRSIQRRILAVAQNFLHQRTVVAKESFDQMKSCRQPSHVVDIEEAIGERVAEYVARIRPTFPRFRCRGRSDVPYFGRSSPDGGSRTECRTKTLPSRLCSGSSWHGTSRCLPLELPLHVHGHRNLNDRRELSRRTTRDRCRLRRMLAKAERLARAPDANRSSILRND